MAEGRGVVGWRTVSRNGSTDNRAHSSRRWSAAWQCGQMLLPRPGGGEDGRCHKEWVQDVPRDGRIGCRLAAKYTVVLQPTRAGVALGQLENNAPMGQDSPKLGVPALDARKHEPAEGPLRR